eukprot:4064731-Prymnesium_polylepis.1
MAAWLTLDEGHVASEHGTRRRAAVARAGDIALAVSETAQVEREHLAEQPLRIARLQQPHRTQHAREELCGLGGRVGGEWSIADGVHDAREASLLGASLRLEQMRKLDGLVEPGRHHSQHNERQLNQYRRLATGQLDRLQERSEARLAETS